MEFRRNDAWVLAKLMVIKYFLLNLLHKSFWRQQKKIVRGMH